MIRRYAPVAVTSFLFGASAIALWIATTLSEIADGNDRAAELEALAKAKFDARGFEVESDA